MLFTLLLIKNHLFSWVSHKRTKALNLLRPLGNRASAQVSWSKLGFAFLLWPLLPCSPARALYVYVSNPTVNYLMARTVFFVLFLWIPRAHSKYANVLLMNELIPSQESLWGSKCQLPRLECWVLTRCLNEVVLSEYIGTVWMRGRKGVLAYLNLHFSHPICKPPPLFNKKGSSYCFRQIC